MINRNCLIALISIFIFTAAAIKSIGQVIVTDLNCSSDTAINPFTTNLPIYSLKVYGNITLYSDSSLVRIVLTDSFGSHFLVFEAYPLITDSNSFVFEAGCDETCFLDGIVPDSIRIDILNAFLKLDSLKLDTNYIANPHALQSVERLKLDSAKIAVMNNRISMEHMYWRAGRTDYFDKSFQEREMAWGRKYNLIGYDYFIGGIFEFLHHRSSAFTQSNLVGWFDWRYRHGATIPESPYYDGDQNETGWLTPIQNQTGCEACWAFTASHAVADHCNLYFNHHYDFNLSETEVISCSDNLDPSPQSCKAGCSMGGYMQCAIKWIGVSHVHLESNCNSYTPPYQFPCSTVCLNGNNELGFDSWGTVFPGDIDNIKEALIKNGPLASGIKYPSGGGHDMVMIGFNTVEGGDVVYMPSDSTENPIVIDENSPLIGQVYFVFKNSYGQSGSGEQIPYRRVLFNEGTWQNDFTTPVKILGNITLYPGPTPDVEWYDRDGDGYYWWGIGSKPQNCPGGEDKEDCDDFDLHAGPYNLDPGIGPKYECTPNPCETNLHESDTIMNNDTWNGVHHKDKNIIIPENVTLTITGEVFFTPGVKIIVEAGGKLELIGVSPQKPARLTSGCQELWGGIEIHGNSSQPQTISNQGLLYIYNGIIENAECGIRTAQMGVSPDYCGFMEPEEFYASGGIVKACFATFRNNETSVKIYPYRDGDKPNSCWFAGCRFLTTEQLLSESTPVYHLMTSGINKLNIKGCTFLNTRDNTIGYQFRGGGIYSFNAELHLQPLDTTILVSGIPIPIERDDTINGFNYGFYGIRGVSGNTSTSITDSEILDNKCGIYLSGYTPSDLVDLSLNTITLSRHYGAEAIYGLYLNNCSGYKIRQNDFSGSTLPAVARFGVIVNNSGPENNYIYDNKFENLRYGLQGLNINRNSDAMIGDGTAIFVPTGLRFICNKFWNVGCENDFLINENLITPVSMPGIALHQRNAANAPIPTQEPAGNTFTPTHGSPGDDKYDINISSTVGNVLYSHHTSSYPSNLRLKPEDVSNPDKVGYIPRPDVGYFNEVASCPDVFYPVGDRTSLRSALAEANHRIDSLTGLLELLVDAGSTDTLKSTVENSTSGQSYELYSNLIDASPYLTDTVLKSSIEKEEVLPNAMIRDVMVANPQSAKSDELLMALDQRVDPMPDSMWVEILQGMDVLGAMERLEGELAGWIQHRDLYFNALAELFRNDTLNEWAADSLISLFSSDDRLSSRYLLAQYYLDDCNFTLANSVLQNIAIQFNLTNRQLATHQNYLALVALLPQLCSDTMGFAMPDSNQRIALEQLSETDYSLPGAWARNILIAAGLQNYQEPVFSGTELKSSRKERFRWTTAHSIDSKLRVYPNPARDYIIVEYKKNESKDQYSIQVLDQKGKKIMSFILSKTEDQKIIPIANLPSGNYLIQLKVNQSPKESCKVVVIR
jgi:hypothetical protein